MSACKKDPGPGGKAKIQGRVYAHDWDNSVSNEVGKGYAPGERVYIMYGTDNIPGDDILTSADGSFSFEFLNIGSYKIYANSLDTSVKAKGNDTYQAIIKEIEITEKSQVVDVGNILINI